MRSRLSTGEFRVLRMLGGNIPGETRVLSVAVYDHAQTLEQTQSHRLAGVMLVLPVPGAADPLAEQRSPTVGVQVMSGRIVARGRDGTVQPARRAMPAQGLVIVATLSPTAAAAARPA